MSKNILRPQHNIPETVAFQTMQGVQVTGDFPGLQTLFALVDGRRLYADEQLTQKIRCLDAKPLEVFVICKRKSGRKVVWDVWLSNGSEKARAAGEEAAIYEQLLTSSPGQISGEVVTGKAGMLEATNVTPPAPLLDQLTESIRVIEMRKPAERVDQAQASRPQMAQEFVLAATGTEGPPRITPSVLTRHPLGPIPWNVAFREVLQFVTAELKAAGEQWSDQSRQDIASTILISAAKSKWIGVWER
jgi:hypothetical protein